MSTDFPMTQIPLLSSSGSMTEVSFENSRSSNTFYSKYPPSRVELDASSSSDINLDVLFAGNSSDSTMSTQEELEEIIVDGDSKIIAPPEPLAVGVADGSCCSCSDFKKKHFAILLGGGIVAYLLLIVLVAGTSVLIPRQLSNHSGT